MNEITSLLNLINDNNLEIRTIAMQSLIKNKSFEQDLQKYLKKFPLKKTKELAEVIEQRKIEKKQQKIKQVFKKSTKFNLFQAIKIFNINSSLETKYELKFRNIKNYSLINYGILFHKKYFIPIPIKSCTLEDLTIKQVFKNQQANLTILYAILQNITNKNNLQIKLIHQDNKQYIYDTTSKIILDPYNKWQQIILKDSFTIYDDYNLFTEFVLNIYWFSLTQGELNTIYKIKEIMKLCFNNLNLGYPYE